MTNRPEGARSRTRIIAGALTAGAVFVHEGRTIRARSAARDHAQQTITFEGVDVETGSPVSLTLPETMVVEDFF